MKSFNHLFEELIDYDNVKKALHNAALRKKDRPDVQAVLAEEEKHIANIIYMLENELYTPQAHSIRIINDGTSKKRREIVQPYFHRNYKGEEVYEQAVQHAVVQVLKKVINHGMYFHTNGSIPKRGCHSGKKYLSKFISKNKDTQKLKYFAKFDITKYYVHINIDILKAMLSRKIHDERFLRVVYAVVDSNMAYSSTEKRWKCIGLPIGFYSSQWLANFYLQGFDHFIKEELRVPFYSRYMDDFLIFHSNKKRLWVIKKEIKCYLNTLSLKVKSNNKIALFDYIKKTGQRVGEYIDFMGFKFYRDKITLRKPILKAAKRTAKTVQRAINNNKMNWYIACRMISYYGWFKATNTYKYFQKYVAQNAHIKVCKKLIHQHDHRPFVPYRVKRYHESRNAVRYMSRTMVNRRKKAQEEHEQWLKLRTEKKNKSKGERNNDRNRMETIRKFRQTVSSR